MAQLLTPQDGDPRNRLLTPEQAAAYLNVSVRTLQQLRHLNCGPRFVRVGRQILYPEICIAIWLFSGADAEVGHD